MVLSDTTQGYFHPTQLVKLNEDICWILKVKKSQKCLKTMLNGPPTHKWDMHKNADLKSSQKTQGLNMVKSLTKNLNKGSLCLVSAKLVTH